MSEGKKFDAGKAPLVQGCLHYFPRALIAVSQVSGYGAKKYNVPFSDKNWTRLDDAFNRYTDGLGRHLALEALESHDTGKYDPTGQAGSQLQHAAHVAWNALARLELLLTADPDVTGKDVVGEPEYKVTVLTGPYLPHRK